VLDLSHGSCTKCPNQNLEYIHTNIIHVSNSSLVCPVQSNPKTPFHHQG
jgi:hypothetical protein